MNLSFQLLFIDHFRELFNSVLAHGVRCFLFHFRALLFVWYDACTPSVDELCACSRRTSAAKKQEKTKLIKTTVKRKILGLSSI